MKGSRVVWGQLIGQGALLVSLPIISRMYGPTAFGMYGLATAIAIAVQPLATLRVEHVIPGYLDGNAARARTNWGIIGVIILAALAIPVGSVLASDYWDLVSGTSLVLLAYSSSALDSAMLIRASRFSNLALRNALVGILTAILQIGVGLFAANGFTLAVCFAIGRIFAVVLTRDRKRLLAEKSNRQFRGLETRSSSRVLSAVSAGVISNAATQSFTYVTYGLFGATAAGHVSAAQRAAGTPTQVVGQALAQLTGSSVAAVIRNGEQIVWPLMRRIIARLLAISALTAAMLMVLGPSLLPIALGYEWVLAGELLVYLSVPFALQFLLLPMMQVFALLKREFVLLVLQCIRLVLVLAVATVIGVLGRPIVELAAGLSAAMVLSYLVTLVVLIVIVKARDERIAGASSE